VPDLYQGTERRDYSLVDPDNRRAVDPARLGTLLDGLATRGEVPRADDEEAKAWLLQRLLAFRCHHANLFQRGEYLPLKTLGTHAEHLVAFARRHDETLLIVVVPRLVHALLGEHDTHIAAAAWGDTAVAIESGWPASFEDLLSDATVSTAAGTGGKVLRAADVLARFPVAALVTRPSAQRTR
jgi:(1->4)-alpha-D-glucan 1-alpha-D-glucosylmutase